MIINNDNNDKNKQIIEFLQKEYDNLTHLISENEQLGERRIQFFLTLVGAIIALIGLFGISELNFDFTDGENKEKFQGLLIIFIMVIMILVPFGLMTLKRLINRNIITDRRILDLEYIRNYFKKNASIELKKYFPFQEYDVKRCPRHLEWKDVFSTKRGGLVETAALINCIILGIIGGLFVFYIVLQTISQLNKFNNFDLYYIILTFTLYSLTAWVIQFYYVKIEYEKECKKRNKHLLNRK